MRSYETARSLFSFLEFIAWCTVVAGALALFYGFAQLNQSRGFGGPTLGAIAVLPGVVLILSGLLMAAQVQIGRAGIDTAEYTQQMLQISRDHLEVSRQGLRTARDAPTTFGAKVASQKGTSDDRPTFAQSGAEEDLTPRTMHYHGKQIRVTNGKFLYNGIAFDTQAKAERYIDSFAAPRLQGETKPRST